MNAINLQRTSIVLAMANFSLMLLYLFGLHWNGIFIVCIVGADALILWGLLHAAHKQLCDNEIAHKGSPEWLRPRVMLNAVVGYVLGILFVLVISHHFSRQGFIFLAAGIGFCFLSAKIAEIVSAREIDRL